ncbi:TPA: DUF4209 domain-containing protein [Escherichia coli]|uniref:DUF4209 domain-containing protein n=1 Tax=Escherichia coli TaxID=562 RepID=UPI0003910F13|nr:DUF4209 domain-containing protein [Escherichia coli]EFB2541006.1 DUF4209 domain-containing protein [Escherichia coli]EQR98744.1 hypothetical protein G797_01589 [Escherichia coli HVH 139 (4-3192644)]MBB9970581.1 DUF4209 domain-containing protein [Escherichia coli]MDK6006042.1 DUF4209 domain-containing protein [Escherichia coli]MEC6591314.1 DUF4209 domain-containing protein [Escherichia coli]
MDDINISLDELNTIDLSPLIQSKLPVTCFDITKYLSSLGDGRAEIRLLTHICGFHFRPENPQVPFGPCFQSSQGRSAIPDDINGLSLEVLSQFCPTIELPELQARIADTLWVRKIGGIRFPLLAVRAYYASSIAIMTSQGTWVSALERLERALRLCCFFRKNTDFRDEFDQLSAHLLAEYERTREQGDSPYPLRLLQLDIDCKVSEPSFIAQELLFLTKNYLAQKLFSFAVDACKTAITIANRCCDRDTQFEFWRLLADTHLEESKFQDGGMISAACMQNAIEALANIPGTRIERLALYEEMRDYQIESRHQMSILQSPPQDISEIVHQAKSRVVGRDMFDMVFRLAMLVCRPTSIERLKAQAIEHKANSIAWMFGSTHIDHEGMTLARIPAGLGIDDANGAVIWPIMMTRMRIDHELAVAGQIIPATDEITMKYPISEAFFRDMFINHPFIPFGHEEFFIKGMVCGFNGDFMTACHVLIPQIENSLRYVAKIKGEEPSQLHGDGSQERNGLKGLLDNPLIIEAFGVDIIGNLQALLVDKIYGDLRNQLAHGYVPAGYYNQPPCIFAWWLVLHILMNPTARYWQATYGQESEAQT